MFKRLQRSILAACFAQLLIPPPAPSISAAELSDEQIKTLKALIEPSPDELKWTQIPWMLDLWDARVKAASEGKPIFIWQMDGSPFGCV